MLWCTHNQATYAELFSQLRIKLCSDDYLGLNTALMRLLPRILEMGKHAVLDLLQILNFFGQITARTYVTAQPYQETMRRLQSRITFIVTTKTSRAFLGPQLEKDRQRECIISNKCFPSHSHQAVCPELPAIFKRLQFLLWRATICLQLLCVCAKRHRKAIRPQSYKHFANYPNIARRRTATAKNAAARKSTFYGCVVTKA